VTPVPKTVTEVEGVAAEAARGAGRVTSPQRPKKAAATRASRCGAGRIYIPGGSSCGGRARTHPSFQRVTPQLSSGDPSPKGFLRKSPQVRRQHDRVRKKNHGLASLSNPS